jgi:branched-chain amino acid transport system ATP-binding protein
MAGLLPEEIAEILDLIRRIQQGGMTILLIEHVMDAMLNIAERIVVLEAGKVIAIGGPEEVSNNDRVITAYLGAGYRHA